MWGAKLHFKSCKTWSPSVSISWLWLMSNKLFCFLKRKYCFFYLVTSETWIFSYLFSHPTKPLLKLILFTINIISFFLFSFFFQVYEVYTYTITTLFCVNLILRLICTLMTFEGSTTTWGPMVTSFHSIFCLSFHYVLFISFCSPYLAVVVHFVFSTFHFLWLPYFIYCKLYCT